MEWIADLAPGIRRFLPLLLVLPAVAIALATAHWLLIARRGEALGERRAARQVMMLAATALAIILVILVLPVNETTRGQLLSLLGLVLTGVLGLASTSFVSNAMAGLMLRAVRNFRPGDFVRVEHHFGRVTELGLFHTEIQTEDRDLTTLPNLYLVTHPITVVHASGTIVWAPLSLGYDVAHSTVEPLLTRAAREAGLEEPFVQVLELGNFAVTYRVAGFLREAKQLLTVRSQLRARVLDVLHEAGIEIVSPSFMNQRQLPVAPPVVPEPGTPPLAPEPAPPEALIFDKAEQAARQEALREEQKALLGEIAALERELGSADESGRARLEAGIAQRKARIEAIAALLRASAEAGEA